MPWLSGAQEITGWRHFSGLTPPLISVTAGDFAKLPTQHVKTLNPHLDHAAFDALYTTEHTASTSDWSYSYESMEEPQFGVDFYIPRVANSNSTCCEAYKYAQGHCQANL